MLAARAVLPCLALLAVLLALPGRAAAVVNGQSTTREWPHMAALEYDDPEEGWQFSCGASLVRPDVVLTAAHCVTARPGATLPASRLRFLVGSRRRSAGGERIGAVRIVEHPRYEESRGGAADVALVRLQRAAALGAPIRIAGPADAPSWEPGDPATLIGWGTEFFGSPATPDDLREAQVPIVSDEECEASYEPTFGFDAATSVCAGELIGGADACNGDSGGPLMVRDAAGAWILVGVVSTGLGCAYPRQYGVYAEAGGDALRGWIEQHASGLSAVRPPSRTPHGSPSPESPGSADRSQPDRTQPDRSRPDRPATRSRARTRRVRLPRRLGSARRARRAGRLLVTLRTTVALRRVVIRLRRGRRVVAAGRRATLRAGRSRVTLRARRGLRGGRGTLRLTARDASGRRVTAVRRVRIAR